MDAVSYTTVRTQLAAAMNRVCQDHEPLIITRSHAQSVVMLSLEDYQALEETAYLLKTPHNAQRLLASIEQLEAGQGAERDLYNTVNPLKTRSKRSNTTIKHATQLTQIKHHNT